MSATELRKIMTAIKDSDERKFASTFNQMCELAYRGAEEKGFWEKPNDYQKICLMFTELAEVVEAFREDNPKSEKIPEFTLAEEELADVVIRIMDFAGRKNIRLGDAIIEKIKYNQSRPHKHGKQF